MPELSEQEQVRRNSLNELRNLGINPYPAPLYEVNATSTDILELYAQDNTKFQDISIAGRIMSRRIMGAASFCELQDPTAAYNYTSSGTKYAPATTKRCTTPCGNACWTLATLSA